jgi:hypothetical protein
MDLSLVGRSYLNKLFGEKIAEQVPEEDAIRLGYQIESQKIKDELEKFKKNMSAFPKVGGGGV